MITSGETLLTGFTLKYFTFRTHIVFDIYTDSKHQAQQTIAVLHVGGATDLGQFQNAVLMVKHDDDASIQLHMMTIITSHISNYWWKTKEHENTDSKQQWPVFPSHTDKKNERHFLSVSHFNS